MRSIDDSRNDNDDPQYVIGAFDQIFAHWRTTLNADFAEYFTESLSYALAQGTELNLAIYMTSNWLWCYRYCLHEQGRYAGLFEVDITALGGQLKQALHANKANLMADRRWAGAEWNSPNGLASFTDETVEITQKDVAILRGLATRAPPSIISPVLVRLLPNGLLVSSLPADLKKDAARGADSLA
jgi:hypothetical protein